MAADRTLTELNEAARDDVGAFDGDADRHAAIEAAQIIEGAFNDPLPPCTSIASLTEMRMRSVACAFVMAVTTADDVHRPAQAQVIRRAASSR